MALLKPLKNYIVAEVPATNEVKTTSGIIMNNMDNSSIHIEARVAAIGPDVKGISVGDRVVYDAGKATIVDFGSTEVKLMLFRDEHVFAIISPDERTKLTFENKEARAVDVIAKTLINGMQR